MFLSNKEQPIKIIKLDIQLALDRPDVILLLDKTGARYRAKVYRFRNHQRGSAKIVLDKEAQELVNLFVEAETLELRELLEHYKRKSNGN